MINRNIFHSYITNLCPPCEMDITVPEKKINENDVNMTDIDNNISLNQQKRKKNSEILLPPTLDEYIDNKNIKKFKFF